MPTGKPKLLDSLCDGSQNFSALQASIYLRTTPNKVHRLACDGKLHPVRVSGHLIFARSDLDRQRKAVTEVHITRRLVAGDHPLDIYLESDGVVPLKEVDRIMRDWAKMTGIWLIEAPRGSYARWLERFELVRVSPRALRRLIEAMLVDQDLGAQVRKYFSGSSMGPGLRDLNGRGDTQKARRDARRLGEDADAATLEAP